MTALIAGVLGLLCGSFTNVLISRVPSGEQWTRGASHCPQCHHEIVWYDNVPVLSWLWLRRRCRHCKEPISARYPLVELLVATLFALVVSVHGVTFLSAGLAYLAIVSVALAAIDIEHMRLPDALTLPSYGVMAVAVVANSAVSGDWASLGRAAAGMGVMGGFYFLVWFIYPRGLGFGDVKAAGVLGLALGALSWGSVAVGAIAGPIVGGVAAIVAVVRHGKIRGLKIPFGPWLILGAWIGILAGEQIATRYIDWVLEVLS